ncbi:UNVERIFIED_CONTAM: hypothetical protein Sradi_6227000 [Sesamum radiatum]|uniref:Uncharacterized protein n=1 Tax=Sesamum radiatum TaxID=300843 RepID=A0AAW2KA65_SESRA
MINPQKSAAVFSNNVPMPLLEELADILGILMVAEHKKYLGLLTVMGRSKHEMFDGLKDQVWWKLQNWTMKRLPQAGLEVLIKLVI